MAQAELYPWEQIKERYLKGETAKQIATDYDGLKPSAIHQKSSKHGWIREKEHVKAEVVKRAETAYPVNIEGIRPKVVEELCGIAFSDIANYMEIEEGGGLHLKAFSEMPPGATKCIKIIKERRRIIESKDGQSIVVDSQMEYTLLDKLKALELLAKICGLFTEQITVNNMPAVVAIKGIDSMENI